MRSPTADRSMRIGPATTRPDRFVHALAQLPDAVTLELGAGLELDDELGRLARAYAVSGRLEVSRAWADGVEPAGGSMAELVEGLTEPDDPPSDAQRDDRALTGQRIALVTNLPAPYRIPLFNQLAARLSAVEATFRVFFLGAGSKGRPWVGSGGEMEFGHEVVRSAELPTRGRRPRFPVDIEGRVARYRPDVILCGGLSPVVAPRLALLARRRGAVFGVWSGEVGWRPAASSRARRVARRWVARRADFGISYGSESAEYLTDLSQSLPVVHGRNTSSAYAIARDRPAAPEPVELLTVADMAVPGKGVDVLVDALGLLPELPCRLTVVGGGGRAREAVAARAAGDDRIQLLGAVPQARVRQCYGESDVYLFPSQIDVFGLALVEAMGSGLAPVTSTRPGAAADLAVDGLNCLAVGEHQPAAWARAIERVVIDHDLRARLGAAAAATIARRWTIPHACEAMLAGIRLGLAARESRR